MNALAARKPGAPAGSAEKPLRILAIDYGRKKIGLAISDELCLTARPLAVLVRKNRLEDLKRLRETCARQGVGHIIVGHPVHITGESSEMAEEAARFAVRIGKALDIETELFDERLTSWQARETAAELRPRARGKGAPIDDLAAAVLLRDYLETRGSAVRAAGRD